MAYTRHMASVYKQCSPLFLSFRGIYRRLASPPSGGINRNGGNEMSELKQLLVEELQDLLNAENQIVGALPKMVDAAHNSKLKETFEKHLLQTEEHVNRLKTAVQ